MVTVHSAQVLRAWYRVEKTCRYGNHACGTIARFQYSQIIDFWHKNVQEIEPAEKLCHDTAVLFQYNVSHNKEFKYIVINILLFERTISFSGICQSLRRQSVPLSGEI